MMRKHILLVLFTVTLAGACGRASPPEDETRAAGAEMQLVEARRIWDQAPHNAFTDLLRHEERWWCVFREGQGHVSPDGALRVLSSTDGAAWESAALIRSYVADLRDPKLTVTPGGRLMLSAAGALHQPIRYSHQSYVWFSGDGRQWSEAVPVADPGYWLWRLTWHKEACYGVGYECGKGQNTRLYRSLDGRHFETRVESLYDLDGPNEAALVFEPDDTARCLLRRDPAHGLLGTARPPYEHWQWRDVGRRIGGPCLLCLPDGRLLAAVRLYDGVTRTSLGWLDRDTGRLRECLRLPSGGDTSYAGLAWHDGLLWVSYYSSHEEKTAIYLAKVRVR